MGVGLGRRQKSLLVATLAMALFVTSLNAQIVTVAAPRLLSDLGGFSLLPWLFTSFLLTSTIVTPIAGKLSDTYGRRPFMLWGLGLFIVASVACAAAVSMPMLIAMRALQGIGAGALLAVMMAVVADLFPPAERGKYTSVFYGGMSAGLVLGPGLGGFLTDAAGWRWCFIASTPPAFLCLWFLAVTLPKSGGTRKPVRFDAVGAALVAAATTTLLLGFSWSQREYGWASAQTVGLLAAAALFTALFFVQEHRHPDPLLSLTLFRERNFSVSIIAVGLVTGASAGAVTYVPTFVQVALHSTATTAGLITTPQAIGSLLGSIVGGQLISRSVWWRSQAMVFFALMIGGAIALALMGVGGQEWRISLYMTAIGLGVAGAGTQFQVIVLNAVPASRVGMASATRGLSQQIGSVVAVAALGVVLSTSYESSFADRLPAQTEAALGPTAVAAFDDPTLSIDARRLAKVRDGMLAEGRDPGALEPATAAQGAAVADANRDIFLAVAALLALAAGITLGLRPAPLRKTFDTAPEPARAAERRMGARATADA